ncbi:response regulator, partial [Desulfovibrio sp. OttesenSCG-928-C14]|nr:response regulator [Desulfovibrio sp. OttesenSCG-928-C14]
GLLAPDLQNIFKALFEKPVRPEQLVQSLWEDFNGKPAGESGGVAGVRQTRPCEILLVEDVEINRMVATHMLGELGHCVFEATNGQEALDMLEKRSFDLVFMDIQMPIMDGVTATRKLREAERQNPARPRAAIVAMTANALKGDKDKYLEAGMDDYVSKPFQIDSLIEVIARNVGRE